MDAPDFDEEARKLFKLLNLSSSGEATESASDLYGYHDLDAVWQNPRTGGRVFIGNQTACRSRQLLQKHGITNIVNCTSDMPLYFEGKDPSISYYRFDIYKMYRQLRVATPEGVLDFFLPVFEWIDEKVRKGEHVLVHCLAGAHRAGTTGVAYVMHAGNLDHKTAISACKACRPIVDPINNLTTLLQHLEAGIRARSKADQEGIAQLDAVLQAKHLELLAERKQLLEQECQRVQQLTSAGNQVQSKLWRVAQAEAQTVEELEKEQRRPNERSLSLGALGARSGRCNAVISTGSHGRPIALRACGAQRAAQHCLLRHLPRQPLAMRAPGVTHSEVPRRAASLGARALRGETGERPL
eukprot:TRINITY_DN2204_c0_g1_i2.p1 TRINITY_DN2204_c0_g1~~TRINITY_DN2204_c0_g1_i2.p1  ORF type:complete len:355 (-),score=65.21 TRINITY_DN2204_c0_g1_i2:282-1346(-)